MYLRARVLMARLWELVDTLIINANPMVKDASGKEYQPLINPHILFGGLLLAAIDASHLNTLDTASSFEDKCDGLAGRVRNGIQDHTSLSQFVDDVERLLREIYGESNNQAIERMVRATFVITLEYTHHLQKDLGKSIAMHEISIMCASMNPRVMGFRGSLIGEQIALPTIWPFVLCGPHEILPDSAGTQLTL